MNRSAQLSACGKYRYTLSRTWNADLPSILFVLLNPSTADATTDDPTVRRCIGFASRWGYGGFVIVNLFAYRATDPRELRDVDDPVGPDNDSWIATERKRAACVVAAWGMHGRLMGRDGIVIGAIGTAYCLGTTKDGFPKHPLYLASDAKLKHFCGADNGVPPIMAKRVERGLFDDQED